MIRNIVWDIPETLIVIFTGIVLLYGIFVIIKFARNFPYRLVPVEESA